MIRVRPEELSDVQRAELEAMGGAQLARVRRTLLRRAGVSVLAVTLADVIIIASMRTDRAGHSPSMLLIVLLYVAIVLALGWIMLTLAGLAAYLRARRASGAVDTYQRIEVVAGQAWWLGMVAGVPACLLLDAGAGVLVRTPGLEKLCGRTSSGERTLPSSVVLVRTTDERHCVVLESSGPALPAPTVKPVSLGPSAGLACVLLSGEEVAGIVPGGG